MLINNFLDFDFHNFMHAYGDFENCAKAMILTLYHTLHKMKWYSYQITTGIKLT